MIWFWNYPLETVGVSSRYTMNTLICPRVRIYVHICMRIQMHIYTHTYILHTYANIYMHIHWYLKFRQCRRCLTTYVLPFSPCVPFTICLLRFYLSEYPIRFLFLQLSFNIICLIWTGKLAPRTPISAASPYFQHWTRKKAAHDGLVVPSRTVIFGVHNQKN